MNSEGNLSERVGAQETTKKIDATVLSEIVKMLEELNLPGAKSKIVKGSKIWDGDMSGVFIRLDGKEFIINASLHDDQRQILLTATQKKTLDKLKSKLVEIWKTASSEIKPNLSQEIPVQQEPPPIMTAKVWTIAVYRRNCEYKPGDHWPTCDPVTVFWRGKFTRRGNSFDFDAVWLNEQTRVEVRDKIVLVDAVRERVVSRRDGEANGKSGQNVQGKLKKETPTIISGFNDKWDLLWKATIETEKVDSPKENTVNPSSFTAYGPESKSPAEKDEL